MNKSKKLLREMRKRIVINKGNLQIRGNAQDIRDWADKVDTLLERPQDKYKRTK